MLNRSKLLRMIIPSLFFLAALVYISRFITDIDLRVIYLLSLDKWLLVILLFLVAQLLNILYFRLLLTRMCTISSLSKLFQVLFASYSFNYAGPLKLGMPLRVFLFKRVLKVPYGAGVATVLVTTGLDILVMITLVFMLSVWIYISPFYGLILGLAIFAISIALAAMFQKLPSARPKHPNWFAKFLEDLATLSPVILFCAIVISTIKFLLICLASWIILLGIGATVDLTELTFVYLSSHLAGLLSLVPMGLGIKDATIIELLNRQEIAPAIGIAFVAIDRLVWSVFPLIIGILAGWHLGIHEMIKSVRNETEFDKVGV